MTTQAVQGAERNAKSGYWGQNLVRRVTGNAIIQLHEASAPPEMVDAHGHHGAHIVFVSRGAYVTRVTGENGFVSTPVAVMNPPATWHRDHFLGGKGSFMTVDLEIDGLQDGHSWHDQSPGVLASLAKLSRLLESASTLELEDSAAWLSSCFRRTQPLETVSPSQVFLVWQYIMDSSAPWLLNSHQLASIADMHPNSLPRAFRAQYGITPSALARRRQVELCAESITHGDQQLADLALQFGFYDQAHFTNSFKSVTSVTPSFFRKCARQS